MAISNNGRFIATGGTDQMVKLWDAKTRTLLVDGKGHSGEVCGVAFSPDDKQLVSVGSDGASFVWNIYMPEEDGYEGKDNDN